ncbi:hypothetical protein [Streptomyces laurentii]|uniref:hypothetical protein n=1 Tax=Streptomyces laurentii TaxID=39478 RepID=UPI003411C4FD
MSTTTIAHPREVFPLAPERTRGLHTSEPPSTQGDRPWILQFARTPQQPITIPLAVYDDAQQVSLSLYGGPLPFMQTETPTVPDGSTTSPPPLDEGPKD